MSIEAAQPDIPVSTGNALAFLFDEVDVPKEVLADALTVLDLSMDQLSDTHIHLGSIGLGSIPGLQVNGKCIKREPSDSPEYQAERTEYIQQVVPGFEAAKIPDTTFVVLDLPSITTDSFFIAHGLIGSEPVFSSQFKNSNIADIEDVLCRKASETLMHELLHAPIKAVDESQEAIDQHRAEEEEYIENILRKLGAENISHRLVNISIASRFDPVSLFKILHQLNTTRQAFQLL